LNRGSQPYTLILLLTHVTHERLTILPNPTNGIDTTRFATNYYVEMTNYYVEIANNNVEIANNNVEIANNNVEITNNNVLIDPFIDHERLLFSHVRHSRMRNMSYESKIGE
jgi:outer membrane usher protein FimD/PapC